MRLRIPANVFPSDVQGPQIKAQFTALEFSSTNKSQAPPVKVRSWKRFLACKPQKNVQMGLMVPGDLTDGSLLDFNSL